MQNLATYFLEKLTVDCNNINTIRVKIVAKVSGFSNKFFLKE